MVTMLPALMEGVKAKLTPVSLYWMLVEMAVPVVATVSPDLIGCWLPTTMDAVWLSSTISVGLDNIFTNDLSARAFSTARTSPAALLSV